ncbi:hypothetical protein [Streptomyces sp. NPDC006335]|uniref:hypothetical protein n=1 Tax=Streptomyces sp. NPDC006335 TaxID=3156895 RepID=UPI0033B086E7
MASQARFTRFSRSMLVGVITTMLGSCASPASSSPVAGHALAAAGPPSVGILGVPNAKIGSVWRFAFPLFVNNSKMTVRITSVRLDNVTSGARVEGYPLYSMKDTKTYILDNLEGDKGSKDMTKIPDHSGKPIVIRSHQDSGDYYFMVKIKIIGRIKKHLSGCRVNYTQGNRKYSQKVHCEYALDMK